MSEAATQTFTNVALIDADSIYFKAACVSKKKNMIRKIIDTQMDTILRECSALMIEEATMAVAVKGKDNFRYNIYPEYKGHRKDLDEDLKEALNYGHKYMIEKYDAVVATGMEADDLVSIWVHECIEAEANYVVCHLDKDLNMLPGTHYNFNKEESYFVDYEQAAMHFFKQCLTGDSADGIPGVKGIGPKTADKLLDNIHFNNIWPTIKSKWTDHKQMMISAKLLWMATTFEEVEDLNEQLEERVKAKTVEEFWSNYNRTEENNDEVQTPVPDQSDRSEPDERPLQVEGETDAEHGVSGVSE